MKLVIIFGPQAVGKMTVGQELEKVTGLKLFHNHMTIELVNPFFNYGTEQGRKLVRLFRKKIFEAVASSDLKGLIFTYIWDFDSKEDWNYVKNTANIFKKKGGEIYYVELEATTEERLKRNGSENRLLHKPTKRNLERSRKDFHDSMSKHRMNSLPGEIKEKNYLRIENTGLDPVKVALQIKQHFGF